MTLFRVLVLVVALAAGGVAAYLAFNIESAPVAPSVVELAPQISTQDVLVATADLKQGQTLTAENLRWQRWPEEALNTTFIQRHTTPDAIETYKGSVVRNQFVAGEPIRLSKLARPESGFLSAILPSGKRAIAVRVSAQNTAGGFILPNDRVDVILTNAQFVSQTILRNIKVLAIDQTIEEKNGEAVVVGKTATLELDPKQVETVTAAEFGGTLSLALRSFEDVDEIVAEREPKTRTIRIYRAGRSQIVTSRESSAEAEGEAK